MFQQYILPHFLIKWFLFIKRVNLYFENGNKCFNIPALKESFRCSINCRSRLHENNIFAWESNNNNNNNNFYCTQPSTSLPPPPTDGRRDFRYREPTSGFRQPTQECMTYHMFQIIFRRFPHNCNWVSQSLYIEISNTFKYPYE